MVENKKVLILINPNDLIGYIYIFSYFSVVYVTLKCVRLYVELHTSYNIKPRERLKSIRSNLLSRYFDIILRLVCAAVHEGT